MAWFGKKTVESAAKAAEKVAPNNLKGDAQLFAASLKDLGANTKAGFARAGETLTGAGKATGKFAGSFGETFLTAAKQPVRWTVQGGRKLVQLPSYAVKKHPLLTIGALTFAAVAVVGNALRGNAEKRSNEQLVAQASQQPSYMNSVSPEEAAYMMAMQKSGTGPAGGFAAAQAERAAQAAAPAGPAA